MISRFDTRVFVLIPMYRKQSVLYDENTIATPLTMHNLFYCDFIF